MNAMPPESVDAIVTDPPYGLGFMGRKWDALPPSQEWAEACYRVLKPGGHIAAFGGTRTWHRLAVAIEDAGFEMRDSLAWLYGSGFPKSHDVGKAIDKANGNPAAFREFARAYAAAIDSSPLTHADIDRKLGIKSSSCYWAREDHRGGMPPRHHWEAVQALVDLPRALGALYDEAEREVVGIREVPRGHAFAGATYGGNSAGRGYADTRAANPEAAQWDGWGTALKPAFEPIVLARKPLAEKTVARNVLAHGTGAINVDACRIETDDNLNGGGASGGPGGAFLLGGAGSVDELRALAAAGEKTPNGRDAEATLVRALTSKERGRGEYVQPSGRWPANVLLDQHAAAWIDEQ